MFQLILQTTIHIIDLTLLTQLANRSRNIIIFCNPIINLLLLRPITIVDQFAGLLNLLIEPSDSIGMLLELVHHSYKFLVHLDFDFPVILVHKFSHLNSHHFL